VALYETLDRPLVAGLSSGHKLGLLGGSVRSPGFEMIDRLAK